MMGCSAIAWPTVEPIPHLTNITIGPNHSIPYPFTTLTTPTSEGFDQISQNRKERVTRWEAGLIDELAKFERSERSQLRWLWEFADI